MKYTFSLYRNKSSRMHLKRVQSLYLIFSVEPRSPDTATVVTAISIGIPFFYAKDSIIAFGAAEHYLLWIKAKVCLVQEYVLRGGTLWNLAEPRSFIWRNTVQLPNCSAGLAWLECWYRHHQQRVIEYMGKQLDSSSNFLVTSRVSKFSKNLFSEIFEAHSKIIYFHDISTISLSFSRNFRINFRENVQHQQHTYQLGMVRKLINFYHTLYTPEFVNTYITEGYRNF